MNVFVTEFSGALSVDGFHIASRNCKDLLTNTMVHLTEIRKIMESLRKDYIIKLLDLIRETF